MPVGFSEILVWFRQCPLHFHCSPFRLVVWLVDGFIRGKPNFRRKGKLYVITFSLHFNISTRRFQLVVYTIWHGEPWFAVKNSKILQPTQEMQKSNVQTMLIAWMTQHFSIFDMDPGCQTWKVDPIRVKLFHEREARLRSAPNPSPGGQR